MYKKYVKNTQLSAIEFTDSFEVYKFICKEVGWHTGHVETQKEYDEIKKYGIGLNGTESTQRLFIGDYLANAGNGDFYVIRKEFMEKNYDLVEDSAAVMDFETAIEETLKIKRSINSIILDGIDRVQEQRFMDGLTDEYPEFKSQRPASAIENLISLLKHNPRPRLLEHKLKDKYTNEVYDPHPYTNKAISHMARDIAIRKENAFIDSYHDLMGAPETTIVTLNGETIYKRKDYSKIPIEEEGMYRDEFLDRNLLVNSKFCRDMLEKWTGISTPTNCMPPRNHSTLLDKTMIDPAPRVLDETLKPEVYYLKNNNVVIDDPDVNTSAFIQTWLKHASVLVPANESVDIDIQVLESVDISFSINSKIIFFKYNFKNSETGSNQSLSYPVLVNDDIDIDSLFRTVYPDTITKTTTVLKMYLNEVIKLARRTAQQLPEFVDVRIVMDIKNAPCKLQELDTYCVSFVLTEDTLNKLNKEEKQDERIND